MDGSSEKKIVSTEYGVARGVSTFISFVGWLFVIAGVLFFVSGTSSTVPASMFFQVGMGIGLVAGGLLLVMGAQVTKAVVDTADHSREMLTIMRGENPSNTDTENNPSGTKKKGWTWL